MADGITFQEIKLKKKKKESTVEIVYNDGQGN